MNNQRKNKLAFKPGKSITIRLPKKTPSHIIEYMNQAVNNSNNINSYLIDTLLKQIQKEAEATSKDVTTFDLSLKLSGELEERLEIPEIRNFISQLIYNFLTNGKVPLDMSTLSVQSNNQEVSNNFAHTNHSQNSIEQQKNEKEENQSRDITKKADPSMFKGLTMFEDD